MGIRTHVTSLIAASGYILSWISLEITNILKTGWNENHLKKIYARGEMYINCLMTKFYLYEIDLVKSGQAA